jgi:dihydrofolate reductase
LVDEIRLMIAPVILGDGLHLFGDAGTEQKWHLKNVVAYKNGFVELSYNRPSGEVHNFDAARRFDSDHSEVSG